MTQPTTLPGLSRRVCSLRASSTVAVADRAKAMRREGIDVLSFAAGEPDFDTPERIKRAAIEALNAGQTHYMPTTGDPETRAVVADALMRRNGLPDLTPDHVAISVGGKHSLFLSLHCLLDPPQPGDEPAEALLPVPAWVSYDPIVRLAGGKVVELPTSVASDFKITPEQLRAAITPRSRVLILNSPSNPCGTMYSPAELRALAAVVAEAAATTAPNLVIVTDEIYERIVYGEHEHLSIGSVPGVAPRTVTLNGLSKAYAMTGWRIGYAAAGGEFGLSLMKAIGRLQGQMTTNITSFLYPAIRVALTECDDDVARMRSAFAERARLAHGLIREIPGMPCPTPTGAFYLFPSVSAHFGKTTPGGKRIESALDFAEALLNGSHVAVVPGEDFGGCGREHVRISFACGEDQIRKGMARLAEFVESLR